MIRLGFLLLVCLIGSAQPLQVLPQPDDQTLAYLTKLADQYLGDRAREIAALTTEKAVQQRQSLVQARLLKAFGTWPEKTPLKPRITGMLQRDGYRIEKLVFESVPNFYVTANVYVPTSGKQPFPAVLGAAGHADEGRAVDIYQRVWVSLAQRGFVVLAWDPPQQGERLDYLDGQTGKARIRPGTQQHVMSGLACLLTGDTLARYFVWDGIRAFDYLLTRKEVDPRRISVAGNSGGGTQAAMLGSVEPRLAATVSSCYMTSSAALWKEQGPQDSEQILPSFLAAGLDYADFALAAAPRPFLIESAVRDFFPIAGARETFAESKKLYTLLRRPDRIGMYEYDDGHGWSQPRREALYRWLGNLFYDREGKPEPVGLTIDTPRELAATATGQVATSLGGETLQSLNRKRAEAVYARRTALTMRNPESLRAVVRTRLAISQPVPNGSVNAEETGSEQRDGCLIYKQILHAPDGLRLPALLFEPTGRTGRKPATLYFNSEGMAKDAGRLETLVKSGRVVLAVDPRGFGELRHDTAKDAFGRHGAYKLSMRALLVSKTLIGMAVEDLIAATNYLASHPSVDSKHIEAVGVANGGVGVLYLAALDSRITAVSVENAPVCYRSFVEAEEHAGLADIVVPGILEEFDLPDLVAAIAPRRIKLVNLRSANGDPLSVAQARRYWPESPAVELLRQDGIVGGGR